MLLRVAGLSNHLVQALDSATTYTNTWERGRVCW